MSAARDALRDCFLSDSRDRFEDAVNAYRDEVQREDAATVRAQAPKYLDNEVDQAIFYALDLAAGLIDPDKK